MCGIAGMLDPRGVPADAVRAMAGCMDRRGPDGEGVWVDGPVGLGHRRLAVIDPTDRAAQPMARDRGALRIVFNGEIYNFRELRAELERAGEPFHTASDTEVLLAGFQRWRDELWPRLRGMFALALWDAGRRELTLVRDPIGKKPLFWARVGERFVFASTLESLRRGLSRTPPLRLAAVNDYLAETVVPGEDTVYEGVHRLPPAGVGRVRPGGTLDVRRYWTLRYDDKISIDATEAEAEVSRLIDQAVERRLVSDVPLGAFLSGGFDSGLVVAAMSRLRPGVSTFTAGTPGSPTDERALAGRVAAHLGTQHTELEVPPGTAADLPLLLRDVGQPFGDASLLPSYAVARAARRHVTVVLTGDGGDEGFFGYTAFQGIYSADRLRRAVPVPPLLRLLGAAARAATPLGGLGARRLSRVLRLAADGFESALDNPMGFGLRERSALLRPEVARALDLGAPERRLRERWRAAPGEDASERAAALFVETTLVDAYLVKVDSATMAASLEARCPLLDVDLLEFLARLPRRLKFPLGRRKHLLRPLVRRQLPPEVLRQPKRGFNVPTGEWLRGALRPDFERLVLGGSPLSELIDTDEARRLFERHLAGENHDTRLWALYALGSWLAASAGGASASVQTAPGLEPAGAA